MLKFDLTGQKFGRLTVLRRSDAKGVDTLWLCTCECGREKIRGGSGLRRGRTTSCGCEKSVRAKENAHNFITHGASKTPTYRRWAGIIKRCYREYDCNYHRYGAKGVVVCRGWNDYSRFLADMGECQPGLTVDRIDGTGNYSCGKCAECVARGWPMNCRWATDTEQNRNRRDNILVTMNGKTKCVAEWCADKGINESSVFSRIRDGWAPVVALTTPIRRKKPAGL